MRRFFEGMVKLGRFFDEKFMGTEYVELQRDCVPEKRKRDRGSGVLLQTPLLPKKYLRKHFQPEVLNIYREYLKGVGKIYIREHSYRGGKARFWITLRMVKWRGLIFGPTGSGVVGNRVVTAEELATYYGWNLRLRLLPGDKVRLIDRPAPMWGLDDGEWRNRAKGSFRTGTHEVVEVKIRLASVGPAQFSEDTPVEAVLDNGMTLDSRKSNYERVRRT